jgi:Ankyrin repeat
LPNSDLCGTGLSAQLTKTWSDLWSPNIQRYIRPLSRIQKDSPLFTYLVEDDVASVQALFSKGGASPFDCTDKAWSLLDYAAWRCAPKTYKFLFHQGAGSDALHPRSTEVVSLTRYLPLTTQLYDLDSLSRIRQCFDILSMVHERRLNSVWGRGGSIFHDLAFFDAMWNFYCLPFEDIITKLVNDDHDIDATDETGCTPLLNACYLGCSARFIKLLIQMGADIHAVDAGSWNAVHQVLHRANYECENFGHGVDIPVRELFIAEGSHDALLLAGCIPKPEDGESYLDILTTPGARCMWRRFLRRYESPSDFIHAVPVSTGVMKWALLGSDLPDPA